jgi:gluconate 5-dehydrogenase
MNLFDISEKTILITGAAGFLGSCITQGFLKQGARVVLLSRSDNLKIQCEEYKRQFDNNKINYYQIDFYNTSEFKLLLETIVNEYKIDILINNAYDLSKNTGFNSPDGNLENSSQDQWRMAFDSGIYWAVLTTQIIGQQFISKNISGSIINISSMYGIVAPDPEIYNDSELLNPASYGVGKAGILAFTRYVASFWGKYNIRCNAISPGPFLDIQDSDSPHKKKFIENLNNKTVLGRTGQPQELIGALIFLSSNASSYITGHNLVIDGGWTIR